jgi:hypothetical protein
VGNERTLGASTKQSSDGAMVAAASSSAASCVDACVTLYSIYNFKYFYSRWSCDQVSHHDLTDTPTQKVTKLFLSGDELYCEFYS